MQDMSKDYPNTDWTFHYGLESFTGTELDFAVDVCDAITDVWQPTPDNKIIMSLPATVEMSTPNIYADQVEYFLTNIKNRESIILSIHTHNDRGCGVAAAEMALMAGADRLEGTLLGNGERTGNMDIVTTAMNFYSQGIDPELDLSNMDEIIACVEYCTNIPLHPRHPYVGELVYSAFSGGHQHAIQKCLSQYEEGDVWEVAYLPIDPKDLGRSYQQLIRINSQSGKGGIAYVLESNYGIKMPRWLQLDFRQLVQQLAEEDGGELSPQQIWELFNKEYLLGSTDSENLEAAINKDVLALSQQLANSATDEEDPAEQLKALSKTMLQQYFDLDIDILVLESQRQFDRADASHVCFAHLNCDGERVIGCSIEDDRARALLKAVVTAVRRYQLTAGNHRDLVAQAEGIHSANAAALTKAS